MIELDIATAEEMHILGERLAPLLRPGDLVLLGGGLGAGKTTLTQGIGSGMNVRGPITSPTFVIARVHPSLTGQTPLVHVDAYRIGGWDELEELDLEATLDESVTVVEWGEGLAEGLAGERLEIHLDRSAHDPDGSPDHRRVRITGVGVRWDDAELRAALSV